MLKPLELVDTFLDVFRFSLFVRLFIRSFFRSLFDVRQLSSGRKILLSSGSGQCNSRTLATFRSVAVRQLTIDR